MLGPYLSISLYTLSNILFTVGIINDIGTRSQMFKFKNGKIDSNNLDRINKKARDMLSNIRPMIEKNKVLIDSENIDLFKNVDTLPL